METKNKQTKTPLALLMAEKFPGVRFSSAARKPAGTLLKKGDIDGVIRLLQAAKDKDGDLPGDFKPPAKCPILNMSRPISEWPISQASQIIQTYLYGLSEEAFQALPEPAKTEAGRSKWLSDAGVSSPYIGAQGLNSVFSKAYSIRNGVRVKYDNKVENLKKKGKETPEFKYVAPGVNQNVYCFQAVSPEVKDKENAEKIFPRTGNRLDIPKGEKGYVPEWQRGYVNHKRKRIRAYGKAPIEGILRIDDDWVTFDLRGLLRNVRWRIPSTRMGLTPNKLMSYFTGDPAIDPIRNLITFSYKEAVLPIRKGKPVTGKRTAKELANLRTAGPLTLISIDLGVNNPIAAKFSAITEDGTPNLLDRTFLPKRHIEAINLHKRRSDKILEECRELAIATLTSEQQAEVRLVDRTSSQTAKNGISNAFGIPVGEIAWNDTNSKSTLIADWLIKHGRESEATYINKDQKVMTKRDSRFARDFKGKLSKETNTALLVANWEKQKTHPGFVKQSKSKLELARRITNELIDFASTISEPGATIAVAVEDLSIKFFNGSGSRKGTGWESFFTKKAENRWFIDVLHKTLTDLATWRGITVCEVNPRYTSQTCPSCGLCDKENRDSGTENFVCLGCGICLNADLEVATDNIEKVALTGIGMKGPTSTDVVKTKKVRKSTKKSKKSDTCLDKLGNEVLESENVSNNNKLHTPEEISRDEYKDSAEVLEKSAVAA